jgi:hypothetical protein
MGMHPTSYILLGYKFPQKEVDLWDDDLLPFIEGHPGVEFLLLYGE